MIIDWRCRRRTRRRRPDDRGGEGHRTVPELHAEVLQVMRELAREGMTMVVVTHETAFAREVADRVVFMDGGTVIEQGPPSSFFTAPDHPRVRAD